MRKQLLNAFRTPKVARTFHDAQYLFKSNLKSSVKVSTALLFASSAALIGKAFHETMKTTDKNPSQTSESSSLVADYEPFNEEKYQQAIKEKHDVIVFINPENWQDQFVEEVKGVLSSLHEYQTLTKGRKLKVFTLQIENKDQSKEIKDKYKVKLSRDTLLLLKNRYNDNLREFTLEDYFDNQRSLYAYFKGLKKLHAQNIDRFASSLNYLDSDSRVLFAYIPKNMPNYKELITRFGKLAIHFAATTGGEINSFAITEPEVAKKLGINVEEGGKEGKTFMMTKSSKYNNYEKTTILNNIKLQILPLPIEIETPLHKTITQLSNFYKQNFVFIKSAFDETTPQYSLVLAIDENKIKKNELNQNIEVFYETHKELKNNHPELFENFKIIKYKLNMSDKKGYRIYVQDDQSRAEDLNQKYYNKKPLTPEQKQKMAEGHAHTFEYEFPSEKILSKETLIQFLKEVKEGKVPEYFSGKKAPLHKKFSNKVVESTYKSQILDNDKDHVVFLCTKHCSGCKFMGQFYEEFALENLKNSNSGVQYNKINSEKNTLEYLPNFPYTPVFMVLKKEEKSKPFVYRPQYGHPDLLKDFIDITISQKLISEDVEKKIFEAYNANQKLLSQMKLEEIK